MMNRNNEVKPQVLMIRQAAQASLDGKASIVSSMHYLLVVKLQYMTADQFVATVQHVARTIIEEEEAK